MQVGLPNLTYKCSAMSPGNLFISESKRQDHNVCVDLQTECNIATAVYISHTGFSLL